MSQNIDIRILVFSFLSLICAPSISGLGVFESPPAHQFCCGNRCSPETQELERTADLTFCNHHKTCEFLARYEGENITIGCQLCYSTGSQPPVEWKKRIGVELPSMRIERFYVNDTKLDIPNARVNDSGDYVCALSKKILSVLVCEKLIAPVVRCDMTAFNSKNTNPPDWVLRVQCWWNVSIQAHRHACGTTYANATYIVKSTVSKVKYLPQNPKVELENPESKFHFKTKPWCIPASSCNQNQSQGYNGVLSPRTSSLLLTICPYQKFGLQTILCYDKEVVLRNIYRPSAQQITMIRSESRHVYMQISVPKYFYTDPHIVEYRVTDHQTGIIVDRNFTAVAEKDGPLYLIKFSINQLQPYRNYAVKIRYMMENSESWSENEVFEFQTSPAVPEFAPSARPQFVDGAYYADKDLTVLWPAVPPMLHQGPDFQYVVKYDVNEDKRLHPLLVNFEGEHRVNDAVVRVIMPRLDIPLPNSNFTLTQQLNLELWSENAMGQQTKTNHSTLVIKETSAYKGIKYAVAQRKSGGKVAHILWAFDHSARKEKIDEQSFARLFYCAAQDWALCTSGISWFDITFSALTSAKIDLPAANETYVFAVSRCSPSVGCSSMYRIQKETIFETFRRPLFPHAMDVQTNADSKEIHISWPNMPLNVWNALPQEFRVNFWTDNTTKGSTVSQVFAVQSSHLKDPFRETFTCQEFGIAGAFYVQVLAIAHDETGSELIGPSPPYMRTCAGVPISKGTLIGLVATLSILCLAVSAVMAGLFVHKFRLKSCQRRVPDSYIDHDNRYYEIIPYDDTTIHKTPEVPKGPIPDRLPDIPYVAQVTPTDFPGNEHSNESGGVGEYREWPGMQAYNASDVGDNNSNSGSIASNTQDLSYADLVDNGKDSNSAKAAQSDQSAASSSTYTPIEDIRVIQCIEDDGSMSLISSGGPRTLTTGASER